MNFNFFSNWSEWALMIGFVVATPVIFLLKKLVFHLLKRAAAKTRSPWDDFILNALDFPVNLMLASGVLSFVPLIFEIPKQWQKPTFLAVKLLFIVATTLFIQKILLDLHHRTFLKKTSLQTYSGITKVFISIGVYIIALLIFLDTVGISITPLVASLGVGSIAVALALQETLSNFFAGLYLVVDKPVRVGDYIKLESKEEGYVESIGWRSVRIRMISNNFVIVPCSKLAGSVITNYSLPEKELTVPVSVSVDYTSDLEKVEKVTREVARAVMKDVPGGVPEFDPMMRYHTFGDSSIQFTVYLRGKEFVDQFTVRHEFIKKLHRRFQEENIVIPYPIRTVHLHTKS